MLAVLQVAIKIHVFWFQVKMFFFSSLIPIYIYIYFQGKSNWIWFGNDHRFRFESVDYKGSFLTTSSPEL